MARAGLVATGALLIVAGGAAIGYALTRKSESGMTPQASAAMASAVTELDGDIKAARGAVHERATTLAQIATVHNAIVTDAGTAKDMLAGGELAFKPRDGEVIEIGRIAKNGADPEVLLLQPAGAMHSPKGATPGAYAELVDGKVAVTEVVRVEPPAPPAGQPPYDQLGYISVSRPLDLAPPIAKLVDAGVNGQFLINGKSQPVGAMPPAGAQTQEMALSAAPGAKLVSVVAPPKAALPVPILGGGAGAAAVGLVLLLLGLTKKKVAEQPVGAPTYSTLPTGPGNNYATGSGIGPSTPGQTQLTPYPGAQSPSAMMMSSGGIGAGAVIGRWQIVRRLGSGGMADVYLAHALGEAGFEKLVAVKIMHGHLARNQRAVDHFLDEARLAARIAHPNVVQIQDLGKIGEDYVIVMDYVDGVDLERLLASAREGGRKVPLDVGLGILARICDGLNAAHSATAPDGTPLGIIHRDVKAANVLVSKQGGVKVVDFGIAKASAQSHLTVAGETKGTPSMMAPEQRVGEVVDVRADVYSLAAVGYEIVTGHGVNLDLAALAHLGVENWPHLPLPSSLRPEVPPELDEILLGAMAFDRAKRPANCAVYEDAIEAVMKRHGMSASDKDIARWAIGELRMLQPNVDPVGPTGVKSNASV